MIDRYRSALAYVTNVAANAAPFPVGLCKQRTRLAFAVPSDGSEDATEAWSRTKHRVAVTAQNWRPAILWWTGGSNGHGHVAFTDPEPGIIWTVDYPKPGYWNRVPKTDLERSWPKLRYAGASLDIDGVQVIEPTPHFPQIDDAISDLTKARDARKPGPARRKLRSILAQLRAFKKGDYQ